MTFLKLLHHQANGYPFYCYTTFNRQINKSRKTRPRPCFVGFLLCLHLSVKYTALRSLAGVSSCLQACPCLEADSSGVLITSSLNLPFEISKAELTKTSPMRFWQSVTFSGSYLIIDLFLFVSKAKMEVRILPFLNCKGRW